MTFATPIVLWLAVIPLMLLILDVAAGAAGAAWPRVRRLWAGPSGLSRAGAVSARRRWLLWLGLMLVVVAGARPQWGRIEEQTFDQSREVLIALDLSRSMLAEDIKPSRLARAKLLIESLLDRLRGERVGLILFSGTAFLQSPLSSDYEVLREFLPALGPDYLPEGGTDFGRLLATALDSFSNDGGADRFLIVLSDGESQTAEWRDRAEKLAQRGVRVLTIGIGTEAGAVMPAEDGGFVKDERGAVILSRLQPQTLRDLARLTNGTYLNATAWVDLAELLDQTVERGRKGGFTTRSELRLQERYQWFLAAGLVLLAASYWIEFPVRPRVRDVKAARAGAAAAAIAAMAAFAPVDSRAADADLPGLARTLSAQPALSAADAARFADATIGFGESRRQAGQPIPPTVLADGFASVDLGERLDRSAADWPELRRKLEELARPPEQQKQDQKEEEKQENKDEQQQQGGDQDQQEQQQDEQQQQQDQQQSQDQKQNEQKRSGEKAFQEEQEQQQQDESEQQQQEQQSQQSKRNMQTVGGEPVADRELQEKPELAIPLQKLDRVKQQDSPARLFQLMQDDEPRKPKKKERDW